MSAILRAVLTLLAITSTTFAQVQIDDRPKPLDSGPLTKEELNRRKADGLLRDARAQYGLGILRQRHDKLIEAATSLEKALALDPDSLEVRRALVPVFVSIGREEEARTLCREVLDREPTDAETAFQFARLLKADGRPAEAIPVLQKAIAGKDAQSRPERLIFLLSDLYELLEKQGDFAGAAKAQDGLIRTITEKREQLLYGNGFTREDLQASLARAYERLGRACVKLKEYDRAVAAFRGARETLLKAEDPEVRREAVRINWNLSEVAAAQGRWADALEALDSYLEHAPVDIEPYEKKVEVLRKLGRERDVVPALRKYAAREEFQLNLQLLLARELAADARTRREAETVYLTLLQKNIKPEIYRGLFHLYRTEGDATKALDLFDESVRAYGKADAKADDREAGQERARAMLAVLRSDPPLVEALLGDALKELNAEKREINTWSFLAALAARAHKLPEAEHFYRQCMGRNLTPENEYKVYSGLIEVLMYQKKYSDAIDLCQGALFGPRKARNTNAILFEASMAGALAEQGKYDEAIKHCDEAVKMSSENSKVMQRCQRAEILGRAGRYDEAIRECEETIAEFPQQLRVRSARYALSNVYSLQGAHDKSEEQLRLILETDPDAALANNNLGYQLADRNVNLDEAERLIRRAIEVDRSTRKEAGEDGENAAYLDSLGWVLFRQGKAAEARIILEKAAALPEVADDPTVWDHLGDVYIKLDLAAKAKEAWNKARKLYDTTGRHKHDGRRAEVEKKLKTLR
jgi:tetratricopeptide (TPR) repeat protein